MSTSLLCAGILATALLRGAATPLFFAYIYGWLPPLDDRVVVAYVAVFWFTSGCGNWLMRTEQSHLCVGAEQAAQDMRAMSGMQSMHTVYA